MTDWITRSSAAMRNSQLLRLVTVAFLVLLLQIPVSMIGGQVFVRQQRGEEARTEVSSKWGGVQTLSGPALVVGYTDRWTETTSEGKQIARQQARFATFLPDQLAIRGKLTTEYRQRGIFSIPLYRLEVTVAGRFARPDFTTVGAKPAEIDWDRAYLVMGIGDTRAIQQSTSVTWQESPVAFVPGTGAQRDVGSGIHAVVGYDPAADWTSFSFPLVLNGSGGAHFMPFGRTTEVTLQSNYPHPSFQGNWLPAERTIGDQGFEASWSVPYLGRSFPQAWRDDEEMKPTILNSGFGVDLIDPVDHYRMAERSVKYASLFILLTFAALWLFEVRAGTRVHPIQFLMLGGALCLFYLLELSLSEHLAFPLAYVIASVAVLGMVAAYGFVVLRGWARALTVTTGVAFLYGYLYVLLVNEDYALLFGSIGLFLILGLIMYATRHVDWYGAGSGSQP